MAGASPSPKTELTISRSVQELVISGDDRPQRYIQHNKDSDSGLLIDASPPLMEIPVIDLSLLTSSSSPAEGGREAAAEDETEKLKSALCSWGCFRAINRRIESEFLEELCAWEKEFFALPMEEKQKYSRL